MNALVDLFARDEFRDGTDGAEILLALLGIVDFDAELVFDRHNHF